MTLCYQQDPALPFSSPPETLDPQKPGILLELIRHLEQDFSMSLTLQSMPWKRCLLMLEAGEVDGAFAVIWSSERDKRYAFPKNSEGNVDSQKRFWRVKYPVFVRQDGELFWDGKDFRGLRYGLSAPVGYLAHQKLLKLGANYTHELDLELGLQLVSLGRLDGYIVEQNIGMQAVRKLKLDNVHTPFEEAFMFADLYIPLSKSLLRSRSQLAKTFWESLAIVRERYLDQLLRAYGLEDQ